VNGCSDPVGVRCSSRLVATVANAAPNVAASWSGLQRAAGRPEQLWGPSAASVPMITLPWVADRGSQGLEVVRYVSRID
jgi:hypothetical protein